MRNLVVAVFASCCVIGGFWGMAPSAARAQPSCHPIDVHGVRLPRVDLYQLNRRFEGPISRDELGAVTRAIECEGEDSFLMIETPRGRRLVRRVALQLEADIELPACTAGMFDSGENRNASSSGLGGAACRPAD